MLLQAKFLGFLLLVGALRVTFPELREIPVKIRLKGSV